MNEKVVPVGAVAVSLNRNGEAGFSRPLEVPDRKIYEAVEEVLKATDERTYMITSADEYYSGELCGKGMVLGILGRAVKIAAPDGHTIYVLGRDVVSGGHQEMVAPPPKMLGAGNPESLVSGSDRSIASMFRNAVPRPPPMSLVLPSPTPQAAPNGMIPGGVPIKNWPRQIR